MGSTTIVILAATGAAILVSAIIYLIVRPHGEVAGSAVEPGRSFSLDAAPPDGGDYRLWIKYDLAWSGNEYAFGLVYDLSVEVDGNTCFDGQLRMGGAAATDEDRAKIKAQPGPHRSLPEGVIMPNKVRLVSSRREGVRYERATASVYRIRDRRPGSMIAVRGTITPAQGTMVNSLYLFLAR